MHGTSIEIITCHHFVVYSNFLVSVVIASFPTETNEPSEHQHKRSL